MPLRTSAVRIFSGRLPQTEFGWGGSAASEIGRSTYLHHVRVAGAYHKRETCSAGTHHKAQGVEARVWSVVSGILKDSERPRAGLDYMIEQESCGVHGAPASETNKWLEEISEEGCKRARHQEIAAEGLIDLEELRARLAALEDARKTAERELHALHRRT